MSRNRLLVFGGLAAVAAVVIVVAVTVGGGSGDGDTSTDAASQSDADRGPAPSPEPSVAPTPPPTQAPPTGSAPAETPVPAGPTGDVDEPVRSLPAVPLTGSASTGDGVSASLSDVSVIDGSGQGPGNVSGSAVKFTVTVDNGSDEPIPLAGLDVTADAGPDRDPASPLNDPAARPLVGVVTPGQTSSGTYVFTLPPGEPEEVTVTVGYRAGAPLMVFAGRT